MILHFGNKLKRCRVYFDTFIPTLIVYKIVIRIEIIYLVNIYLIFDKACKTASVVAVL